MQSAIRLLSAFFVLAFCAQAAPASAEYPDRPIRIVVPFLAGGSVDVLARLVAPKLEAAWKQPVIVENRAGAGGNIGAEVVARAAPDGYTMMFIPPSPLVINPFLYKNMPFAPEKAFTPVSVMGVMPNILIVAPHVPARNLAELIAFAKANPGKLTYGSQGVGTTPHLTAVMLAKAAGIDIVHVPYRGFPPLLQDLLGSRVDFAFADAGNTLPQVKYGKLRALAVASPKRFFALPDIPTFFEAGLSGFESATWMSFSAPAGTPETITRKWHEELVRIAQMPDMRARFAELGVEIWASSPEEMSRHVQSEIKRWGTVIREAGIKKE